MKVACPTCGKTTQIESEIGDFPTRCQRCGAFLRRPDPTTATPSKRPRGLPLRLTASPPAAPRGQLARILGARPTSDEIPPPIIRTSPSPPLIEEAPPAPHHKIRVRRIRRTALRRAMLRGEMQTLGALGWLGLAVALSLALIVLLLQVHNIKKHPAPLRAGTLNAYMP